MQGNLRNQPNFVDLDKFFKPTESNGVLFFYFINSCVIAALVITVHSITYSMRLSFKEHYDIKFNKFAKFGCKML